LIHVGYKRADATDGVKNQEITADRPEFSFPDPLHTNLAYVEIRQIQSIIDEQLDPLVEAWIEHFSD
jgi:hypothetical protein